MSKRRSIISYDKLTIDQKKQILRDFPDGYINHLTTIKTPTGETLDALIWETDEVIYLVKINKVAPKPAQIDDEEDDFEDDFEKVDIKEDDIDSEEDDEEDDYDKPDEDGEEDEEEY
jgi:DNA-directed RNA polymerase subunit delta